MATRYGGWLGKYLWVLMCLPVQSLYEYFYLYQALGSWRNLRIVGDMATMEGQARVPIYAIAATDRENKLLL